MNAQDPEFILRVLRAFAACDSTDSLRWRLHESSPFFVAPADLGAPIFFWVLCSDEFFLACADAEDVTPENIHVMEQAVIDCLALKETEPQARFWAPTLFVARVRKMRPLARSYGFKNMSKLAELLDACGPERT